jgi:hypothetical protein
MNKVPRIYIFSCYRKENKDSINEASHSIAILTLIKKSIAYKEVIGCYQGVEEQSILVVEKDDNSVQPIVEQLCRTFKQDCYLVRDTNGNCSLVYSNIPYKCESLDGQLVNVPKKLAIKELAYTYDPKEDAYYIVK